MRATTIRHGKRQAHVAGILLLAGVFLFHGMRSLDGYFVSSSLSAGAAGGVLQGGDAENSCDWEEGGPVLYLLEHCQEHPSGKFGKHACL